MKIKNILAVLCFACLLSSAWTVQADEITGIGGLCLDIKGGAGKGKQIIVWPCNDQLNQQWYMNGMEIRSAEGYCLDVKASGGKGTPVIAWYCNDQKNQRWIRERDGTIRTQDGLCLDVKGGKAVKGAEVIVWNCKDSDNKNQQWKFRH